MFDKESFFEILPIVGKRRRLPRSSVPKHVAVAIEGNSAWEKRENASQAETFGERDRRIIDLVKQQVRSNIPILTLYLLPDKRKNPAELESIAGLFSDLKNNLLVHSNKMKISVLGKWYDLPGNIVDEVKEAINETKDYDRFFLNFCLNYSGHGEIVDSCRLIVRKIRAGKIKEDDISEELIKENLYSSYFLPPDLIIKTGSRRTWSDLLLWDSENAFYYFAAKPFNDFAPAELVKAMEEYARKE